MVAAPVSFAVLAAIGVAAGAATLLGGALALRLASRVHLVLGFSAGAVIGVALLDLLPEALELGRDVAGDRGVTALAAVGFLAYLAADRALLMLEGGSAQHRGHFGAGALTVHSLLDGLAIGLGLQASVAVGLALTVAVLAHDLADGVNTVSVSLTGSKNPAIARRWLIADAAAPAVGIVASRAVFSGLFLYIGASELLPESHQRHPHAWTTASTLLGVALIWAAGRLAGA